MNNIKVAKVKPEFAPEVIEALRTLRTMHYADMNWQTAFEVLDNAGIFAAVDQFSAGDQTTCSDGDCGARAGAHMGDCKPREALVGSDEWHHQMGEALAKTPLYAPRINHTEG